MSIRGKEVKLNLENGIIWVDDVSGLRLNQWSRPKAIVPQDKEIDISEIEKAIELGALLLVESDTKKPKSLPKKQKVANKEIIGEPEKLIKHTATHLINNVIGRCSTEALITLCQLESAGRNISKRPRKTLINALLEECKKRGVNEALIYNNNDELVWNRAFDQEKGFPGEPKDTTLKSRQQDLEPE